MNAPRRPAAPARKAPFTQRDAVAPITCAEAHTANGPRLETPVTFDQRDAVLDRINTLTTHENHTPRRLVLDLLAATLANDGDNLNRLINRAGPDDARWAAARLANITALYLIERHGRTDAGAILTRLLEETTGEATGDGRG